MTKKVIDYETLEDEIKAFNIRYTPKKSKTPLLSDNDPDVLDWEKRHNKKDKQPCVTNTENTKPGDSQSEI